MADYDDVAAEAEPAREALFKGLNTRIHASVMRRTPFLSEAAANELADDVLENVAAYLKAVFDL